jgi:hypothetical protein
MADLHDDFSDLNISEDDSRAPAPDYHKRKRSNRFNIKLGFIFALIIVLAIIILTAWIVKKRSGHAASTTSVTQSKSVAVSTQDTPATTGTKSYSSDIYNLTLSYPNDWTLSVATDYSIRIVSPAFQFKTILGTTVHGNFRLYMRQTARVVDDKYIGRAVAIASSQSLAYTKPTATQRQSTYLTNFGLDTPDNFAFFFIAGNFNLNKGDTLGPNYGTEAGTDIISGGFSSSALADDMATYQVPLSYYSHTNAYKQSVDIVKSLQLQ